MPLIGLAGAAIDYSRAVLEQTKLQRATDAMAVALVRETSSGSQLQLQADRLLRSLYTAPDFVTLTAPLVNRTGGRVTVQLGGTVKAAFMPVLGLDAMPLGTAGEATLTNAELALVLDNTGSMADPITGGRKIDALKSAARRLLNDLREVAGKPETVKVSIVPFDTEVRLDTNAYRFKPWFRWNNESTDRPKWTGYVYDRHGTYALSDAAPEETKPDSRFPVPLETGYTTNATLKALSTAGGTLAAIQPLTSLYDGLGFKRLTDTIDAMTPRGYTNVALGTMWGLATLSRSEPFSEGVVSTDPSVRKYMVVLTDGLNNYHHVNGQLRTMDTGRQGYGQRLLADEDVRYRGVHHSARRR